MMRKGSEGNEDDFNESDIITAEEDLQVNWLLHFDLQSSTSCNKGLS